jgi:O-antigen ligase
MTPFNILLAVISPYTAMLPVTYIAFKSLQRNMFFYKNPWNLGLLLLFFWSLISGIINMNSISTAASVIILIFLFAGVYLQNYYNDEEKVEKLFRNFILASIGCAFLGILEKITAASSPTIWWGDFFGISSHNLVYKGYRIYSTFGNPNIAGTWYAIMILAGLYFYDNSAKWKKAFYTVVTCLLILALYLTGSRGAAGGLVMGLTVYALLRRQWKNMGFLVTIFVTVTLLMIVPSNWFPSMSVINNANSSMTHAVQSSITGRSQLWQSAINMFKLKPVTGWGLLGVYFADSSLYLYHARMTHLHNIWLTLIAMLGIVGLGIYLYMKFYLFESLRTLYNNKCRLVPLLAGIQLIFIGHGIVDFTILSTQGGLLFFGASAIISALAAQYTSVEGFPILAFFHRKKPAKMNL